MIDGNDAPDTVREQHALLAAVRHELRAPITTIIGYSEMLIVDTKVPGAEQGLVADLGKIRAAGAQLLVRVNTILDRDRIAAEGAGMEVFGATLRDELRIPINAIIGSSEVLIADATECGWADAVPELEHICFAATRFLALIDDFVVFGATEWEAMRLVVEDSEDSDAPSLGPDVLPATPAFNAVHPSFRRGDCHPILVVDDSALNRDILSRRLEAQGYGVAVAENGRRALEMARAQPFDLMLLDMLLPEMNGYQVLQLWMADAALREIPVIIVSALDDVDSVARCVELGAADYLTKPFNPIILHARLEACMEKKWLRDQEVEYLRNVSLVSAAAAAVESSTFDPQILAPVAARTDGLGQLARVFQRMAHEVVLREARLKQQVQELRIEIDQAKKSRAVSEIADTPYFQDLKQRAARLRKPPI